VTNCLAFSSIQIDKVDANINVTLRNPATGRYSIRRRKPSLTNGDGLEAFLAAVDTSGIHWVFDGGIARQAPPGPLVAGQVLGAGLAPNANAALGIDIPGMRLPNPAAFTPPVENGGKTVVRKEYDVTFRFISYLYSSATGAPVLVATVHWGFDALLVVSTNPAVVIVNQGVITEPSAPVIYMVGIPGDLLAIQDDLRTLGGTRR